MKTRDSPEKVTALPSAPAPTARDANRWTITEGRINGKGGAAARATGRVRAVPQPGGRRSLLQGAAGPLAVALAMGLLAWLRSHKGGGFESYRGLLILVVVVAFLVISYVTRRAASRSRGGDPGG